MNEQARALGLGSGGFDVLYANLTRGLGLAAERGRARDEAAVHAGAGRGAARGGGRRARRRRSTGMPVVCCSLHSQVAPVCAALGRGCGSRTSRSPGGALPVSLSDTVRELKARGLARGRRSRSAPCLDGDVRVRDGRVGARVGARRAASTPSCARSGPGSSAPARRSATAGSRRPTRRTPRARSAARPILAVRVSERDERERHRGVSHHTRAALRLCARRRRGRLAGRGLDGCPRGSSRPRGGRRHAACARRRLRAGCRSSHMGRGPDGGSVVSSRRAFAAGRLARSRLTRRRPRETRPESPRVQRICIVARPRCASASPRRSSRTSTASR